MNEEIYIPCLLDICIETPLATASSFFVIFGASFLVSFFSSFLESTGLFSTTGAFVTAGLTSFVFSTGLTSVLLAVSFFSSILFFTLLSTLSFISVFVCFFSSTILILLLQ